MTPTPPPAGFTPGKKSIYRYVVSEDGTTMVGKGAVILSAHWWKGDICVWAIVDEDARPTEVRSLHVAGTGHRFPDGIDSRDFIGTVLIPEDGLVFHVFELGRSAALAKAEGENTNKETSRA